MNEDEHVQRHYQLCKRVFERMQKENSFPWVVDPEGWAEFEKTGHLGTLERIIADRSKTTPEQMRHENWPTVSK